MIDDITLGYLILLFPLITFVVNGLFLGNKCAKAAAIFAVICNGLAFAAAGTLAFHYFSSDFAPQKAILFDHTFIPFEVVSVLLLMTLICAITVARKTKDEVEKEKAVKQ